MRAGRPEGGCGALDSARTVGLCVVVEEAFCAEDLSHLGCGAPGRSVRADDPAVAVDLSNRELSREHERPCLLEHRAPRARDEVPVVAHEPEQVRRRSGRADGLQAEDGGESGAAGLCEDELLQVLHVVSSVSVSVFDSGRAGRTQSCCQERRARCCWRRCRSRSRRRSSCSGVWGARGASAAAARAATRARSRRRPAALAWASAALAAARSWRARRRAWSLTTRVVRASSVFRALICWIPVWMSTKSGFMSISLAPVAGLTDHRGR